MDVVSPLCESLASVFCWLGWGGSFVGVISFLLFILAVRRFGLLPISLCVAPVLFVAILYYVPHCIYKYDHLFVDVWGDYDDYEGLFSPVSVFFSSIASLGAIVAVIMQASQFKMQRFDDDFSRLLELHRENVLRVNEITKDQDGFFKDTYRDMCILYRALSDSHYPSEDIRKKYGNNFTDKLDQYIGMANSSDKCKINHIVSDGFVECYKEISCCFGSETKKYFHGLYRLIAHVDDAPYRMRKKYSRIIRTLITQNELQVLYYDVLVLSKNTENDDRGKFKKLLERYMVFHNMEMSACFDSLKHSARIGLYSQHAFYSTYDISINSIKAAYRFVHFEVVDALGL